ncbi:MAG: ABC transporter permease [Alistipes sp.]|nr:ABC transporter permease [Alistipes sp.]
MDIRLLIAQRYLRSRNSHSVINLISKVSIVAMTAPVAAMIVLMSVFNGLEGMTLKLYDAVDADITISPASGTTMPSSDEMSATILSTEGVEVATEVLQQGALASFLDFRTIVRVKGVDNLYKDVIPIDEQIVAGTFTTQMEQNDCAVIGPDALYNMHFSRHDLGENIDLYAINRARFSSLLPVGGYTKRTMPVTGVFSIDKSNGDVVFTSLRAAQELFNYPDRISAVELKTAPTADLDKVADDLRQRLGEEYKIKTRYESNSIYRLMALEKWGVFFISAIVLAIASLSIVGTLVMIIIDKRDDVATLRTLGLGEERIRGIFITEGYLMALISLVVGVTIGVALTLLQQYLGIVRLNTLTLMVDAYPVELRLSDVVLTIVAYALIAAAITRLTVGSMMREERK